MNQSIRDRIIRHLDGLSDERGYQVLDYIEFLESKYASTTASAAGLFQRFTEGIEDTLRAGRVSTTAIAETVGLLNKAVGVLGGVAAAGKSVASDFVSATASATAKATGTGGDQTGAPGTPPAVPPVVGEPRVEGKEGGP